MAVVFKLSEIFVFKITVYAGLSFNASIRLPTSIPIALYFYTISRNSFDLLLVCKFVKAHRFTVV
jgi:hypothetical protein